MKRYGSETFKGDFGLAIHTNEHVPIHWHSFYEIELCLNGTGVQYLNGTETDVETAVITLLTPNDFHRIESSGGEITLFNLFFYNHVLSQDMINLINESAPPFCVKLDGGEFSRILYEMKELKNEESATDKFHLRALKSRISSLCIDIIRKAVSERKSGTDTVQLKRETKTFKLITLEIIPYINDHFKEAPTRDDIAAHFHLNRSYFSEIFKKNLGLSYSEYLTNVRMGEAMRSLKYTDRSINEIMSEIGYSSPTAFYTQFKRYFGMLPGDVRRFGYEYE